MKKPKKKDLTPEEMVKNFEEFLKRNEVREITKEEFEKNLKKVAAPKDPEDNQK